MKISPRRRGAKNASEIHAFGTGVKRGNSENGVRNPLRFLCYLLLVAAFSDDPEAILQKETKVRKFGFEGLDESFVSFVIFCEESTAFSDDAEGI